MEDTDPLSFLEPKHAREVYGMYDSDSIKDQKDAIEYAAAFEAIPGDDYRNPDDRAHEAQLDIDIAKHDDFSRARYNSVPYHKLLQFFMDKLDKDGLFVQDSQKTPPTVSGLSSAFQMKYGKNNPDYVHPMPEDFEKVGADIYPMGYTFFITGYDSGVDKRHRR